MSPIHRRSFLSGMAQVAGAGLLSGLIDLHTQDSLERLIDANIGKSAAEIAHDEDFWNTVKHMYTVSPSLMNLNNGGVSPQPRVVQEAVEHYNRMSNEAPSYYMWRILDKGRKMLRSRMAKLAGCSAEEIAFDRNSSEALETIIFGLRLKASDEVVVCRQDYPNMINAWRQREHRDGVVLKWVDLNLPSEDDDYLVDQYVSQFTDKTKLVHITHMINWNGQILPVRKIADVAKARGIEVLVDAAHSFAHIDFKIPDLNCDYLGTSLHKWLCAPFGSGLLYVRKPKISRLYPLFASPDPESDDIRKFEHLGTRSFAIEQAIGQAIEFHQMIGSERKQARLQYLKNYWVEKAMDIEGFSIHTSLDSRYACALALCNMDGYEPAELTYTLMNDYSIHTVPIDSNGVKGVRVTPNVYTLKKDLDIFVDVLKKLSKT